MLSTAEDNSPIRACMGLFSILEENDIRYCHWKSNQALRQALAGLTDLDILVDKDSRARLLEVFHDCGILQVISPLEKRYTDIEDHIGFDADSGRQFHIHLHYRLIVGKKYVKTIHLPLEDILFEHICIKYGVRVPTPAAELFILVIRAHLKMSMADFRSALIGGRKNPYPKAIVSEFKFLSGSTDWKEFAELLKKQNILPRDCVDTLRRNIASICSEDISLTEVRRLRILVLDSVRGFNSCSQSMSNAILVRNLIFRSTAFKGICGPRMKKLPNHGYSIAMVGADGSGKTTNSRALSNWLSWKMSSRLYYFGLPRHALFYRVLTYVGGKLRKHQAHSQIGFRQCIIRFAVEQTDQLLWLFVAFRRLVTYFQVRRFIANGGIAVIDRYPLPEFWCMNEPMDGPRIKRHGESAWLAGLEKRLYTAILPPDLTIVLNAPFEVLRKRKFDLSEKLHREKIVAVSSLLPSNQRLILDASQSNDQLLLEVKRNVWELLTSTDSSAGASTQ